MACHGTNWQYRKPALLLTLENEGTVRTEDWLHNEPKFQKHNKGKINTVNGCGRINTGVNVCGFIIRFF